jgi:predicted RNA binding protein YcfA (HicA-like mRNA interferase family)
VTKLPRIPGKKAVKALKKAGFVHIRTRGSHFFLYHKTKDVIVSVPVHSGKTLAPKTLKSILKHARLTSKEFQEYL